MSLKLIVLGNGPFSVPMLRALVASEHEVLRVVVRPPRIGKGKHKHPAPSPGQLAAEELGVLCIAPTSVNDEVTLSELVALKPDLLVVCDYGEILRAGILNLAPLGAINLHGSLLPKYRGAAPVAWPIYHGDQTTGNSVIQVTPGLDSGPIYAMEETNIEPHETAETLEARLAELGGPLVVRVVDQIAAGTITPEPQNRNEATKAPRLKKTDGLIDWSRTAAQIDCQVRAMQPWPGSFTFLHRADQKPLRILIGEVAVLAPEVGCAPPGAVLSTTHHLTVATGKSAIEILKLQPAGKRMQTAEEFLRGNRVSSGDRFCDSEQSRT